MGVCSVIPKRMSGRNNKAPCCFPLLVDGILLISPPWLPLSWLHLLYLLSTSSLVQSLLHFFHPNYSAYLLSVLSKIQSTIMVHSFTPFAVALLLPTVLACENPDTHPCASVFTASTALVTSFCATYTASVITATTAIPSVINSACSSKSLTISEACTCFVTPATAATVSTSITW